MKQKTTKPLFRYQIENHRTGVVMTFNHARKAKGFLKDNPDQYWSFEIKEIRMTEILDIIY